MDGAERRSADRADGPDGVSHRGKCCARAETARVALERGHAWASCSRRCVVSPPHPTPPSPRPPLHLPRVSLHSSLLHTRQASSQSNPQRPPESPHSPSSTDRTDQSACVCPGAQGGLNGLQALPAFLRESLVSISQLGCRQRTSLTCAPVSSPVRRPDAILPLCSPSRAPPPPRPRRPPASARPSPPPPLVHSCPHLGR